jgi:hypothetical protein
VRFRADLPELLRELATRFEFVWATAWQDSASLLLAPALGLPELPVVRFSRSGARRGRRRLSRPHLEAAEREALRGRASARLDRRRPAPGRLRLGRTPRRTGQADHDGAGARAHRCGRARAARLRARGRPPERRAGGPCGAPNARSALALPLPERRASAELSLLIRSSGGSTSGCPPVLTRRAPGARFVGAPRSRRARRLSPASQAAR